MCLTPYITKNTYNIKWAPKGYVKPDSRYKDYRSAMLEVPCGVCPECRSLHQTYITQRCQLLSTDHVLYFGTLTYNNAAIRHTRDFHHLDCTVRNYVYADYDDFRLMIKRLRKYGALPKNTKYMCAVEYGGTRHRPHYHFILFVPKLPAYLTYKEDKLILDPENNQWSWMNLEKWLWNVILKEWKRKISKSDKYAEYQPLCTYIKTANGRRTYDLRMCDNDSAVKVAKYVSKYVLKFDPWINKLKQALHENLEPADYAELWQLIRPKCIMSKFFGVDNEYYEHVRKGIDHALHGINDFQLKFYDVVTGRPQPLAPYLRNHYMTLEEQKLLIDKQINAGLRRDDSFIFGKADQAYNDGLGSDYIDRELARYAEINRYLSECNNNDYCLIIDDE